MPGSPATTPNMGLPRYADGSDTASFSADVNAIVDTIDASAYIHAPGDLIESAAATRAGCVLCDGAAYSRAAYAALFTAIGTTYGAGDGSTTFNVPDYVGRGVIGAGTGSGLTARARGDKGGEETHVLDTAEMPSHNHPGSAAASHSHSTPGSVNVPTIGVGGTPISRVHVEGSGSNAIGYSGTLGAMSSTASTAPAVTVASQGGGGAHNNMQPYGVANIFIFTGPHS